MRCDREKVASQSPRDLKQLRNLRYDFLHKSRMSKDALYNVHKIAYDIPGFVWKIITYPDLIVIFGLQELLDEMDKVLLKAPFVTDREKAITNALQAELPKVFHVSCWNHVIRDIRFWLSKHGALSSDIAVYLDDIASHTPDMAESEMVSMHQIDSDLEYTLSPLTSGDEDDCDCSLILVPEYQKDTLYDDITGINHKESYISVAEQFVKSSHPPIRIGSIPVKDLFSAIKSHEGKFIKTALDPSSSEFFTENIFEQKKRHIPDIIWPLTDDVLSQQIFLYLEELTSLHCKDVGRRKATAVKLLWPEAMVICLEKLKGITHEDAVYFNKKEITTILP
uniref:MULE transposase domain-containing protein n=1 Tax=Amphimedon queenslandica TaxID=400682 RepID=A0A1X7TYR6_AMPQE